jgi:hypothetical protein
MRTDRRLLSPVFAGLLGLGALIAFPCSDAGATTPISFELRTLKKTYLAGEPVVVLLTIRGSADLFLEWSAEELAEAGSPFRFLVDRGRGFTRYRTRKVYTYTLDSDRVRRGDGECLERILSYDDATKDWLFPAPGSVQLMAEYEDPAIGLVRSAPVELEIVAPTGDEKVVHDLLRDTYGPTFLAGLELSDVRFYTAAAASLVQRYPRSVYLQAARVMDLDYRVSHISDRLDPQDRTSPPPKDRALREQLTRERRAAFLPEAEGLAHDLEGGQFAPGALLTLAHLYQSTGDEARARDLFPRIATEFPDRAAGREALKEIGDETAPTLSVTATPARLWPPNHKMVRVVTTINVSDDQDSNPAVKLVSITCDDGCFPSQDIAGAELGTDDREFELRAERQGGGSGRTYTITYSATNASDNSTSAVATVVVPHDLGK